MLKKIISEEALLQTAELLAKKKSRAGFDGMTPESAYSWIYTNSERLQRDIIKGNYRPLPAISFRSAKTNGKFRTLVRLSAVDSVLQTVLNNALSSVADAHFSDSSFAYRSERGVDRAVKRYVQLADCHRLAGKLDFNSCFTNIDHSVLEKKLIELFNDKKLCELLMLFVKTPVYVDGQIVENDKGLLQGMPLSPLLSNVYFDIADKYMEQANIPFVRYADDIVFFADTLTDIRKRSSEILSFFENTLGLTCNESKTRIDAPTRIVFLGHKFLSDKRGIVAFEANADITRAYDHWHTLDKNNDHGRFDIVSDGILKQKDISLLFDTDERDTVIPPVSTNTINIFSNVVFDSGFLDSALKNGISINIFDRNGVRIGSILPTHPLSSVKTTHEQLNAYYNNERRFGYAKEFLLASIHNTLLNIRYYNKQNRDSLLESSIKKLEKKRTEISETFYGDLLLPEACCREIYYGCYDTFLKRDGFVFEKRTRRPAKNEVNALLNFGNSVLYNLLACEIEKTPLDIRVGFLHATNTRYTSLNLDLAEIFKPLVVDRTVFTLINKGEITLDMFEHDGDAVYLRKEAKRVFLKAFYEKLDTVISVKNMKMSYNSIISDEIRKLVRSFRGDEKYKAFRQVR